MISPNPHLANLPVYEPGRPIEDVARDFGLDPASIIKLASNENPLGPSPNALQAIRDALGGIQMYPDGNAFLLRQAIAKKHGLAMENVVLGNGSNEIIEFLGHAYLSPGDELLISQYTFVVYPMVGRMFQSKIIEVPAKRFGHDLEAMKKAITPKTKLIFVANPNNPTGTSVSASELKDFIQSIPDHAILVVDEAYYEFWMQPLDTPSMITHHPNLVVMRTFSKAQGLAGLRIGYGLASKEVAAAMQKVRQPFQANLLAQVAALAALADTDHVKNTVQVTAEGRKWLEGAFSARNWEYVPSSGNFVMVKVGDGKQVADALMKKGVIVRPLHGYQLPEWIRVTVGTPEQNRRFMGELEAILSGKPSLQKA